MREMATVTEHTIDIEKILKGKMGANAKFVPKPLVNWLKKIAHQEQVNAFLWESRDKVGVEWLEECVRYLDMTLNIVGKENLPDPNDGKLYTFVSNHPLGGEDGVALGAIIGRFYDGRFRYLVNDLLMNLPGLAPLCIPINKTGNQSRNFPAMVEAGFQSDHHMLMFPAGICSRKRHGVIQDLPWKKTFISKSVEYQRDVVPIHFSGDTSELVLPYDTTRNPDGTFKKGHSNFKGKKRKMTPEFFQNRRENMLFFPSGLHLVWKEYSSLFSYSACRSAVRVLSAASRMEISRRVFPVAISVSQTPSSAVVPL